MTQTLELCWLFYQWHHHNTLLSKLVLFSLKMIFFSTYLWWHYLIPWTLDYCLLFYQLQHRNAFLSKLGYFLLKMIFFSTYLRWHDSNLWTLDYCQLIYQLFQKLTSGSSSLDRFSGRISEPADLGSGIDKDLFPQRSVIDQDLLGPILQNIFVRNWLMFVVS